MRRYFALLTVVFSVACTTSESEKPKDLDVALEKIPASATRVSPTKKGKTPSTQDVLGWKQFFRSPPNEVQRSLLAQNLITIDDNADSVTLLKRGRNQVSLGQLAAAEASFRLALRKDPDSAQAMLESAQYYLRTQAFQKAFDFLVMVKQQIDSNPALKPIVVFRYKYILALTYVSTGEVSKGHKILSDLIATDKSFTPGYAALASSYMSNGKRKIAEFIIQRGLDRGKDDPALLNLLGVLKQRAGNRIDARRNFDKALKISPTYSPAIVNRANLMLANREFDTAEIELQRAITFTPGNSSAYVSLGICLKNMGRFADAKESFTKAIDLQPDNASARFNLGVLMANELEKPTVALRLFNEVLQTQDNKPEVKQMARLYIDNLRQSNNRRN